MLRSVLTILLACVAAVCLAPASRTEHLEQVDTALAVAVDISDSVDSDRYRLQMEGIARALEDPDVIGTITSGPLGRIGFALVEWADTAELTIPWRIIGSPQDGRETAMAIRRLKQKSGEYTCVSRMLAYVHERVISDLPFTTMRSVVDVSGDGIDNCREPGDTKKARDALVDLGVQINGLPIIVEGENDVVGSGAYRAPGFGLGPVGPGTSQTTLDAWYTEHVIGGPAGFVIRANGFEDFERAFRLKFVTEISGFGSPALMPSGREHPTANQRTNTFQMF